MMNIRSQLEQLTTFLPIDRLEEMLRYPLQHMPEPATALLPSVEIGGDGLLLKRIVLLSENYICDVRTSDKPYEYDFIDRHTVQNYRISVSTHEIKEGETVKKIYYVAEIQWLHTLTGFATVLSFAGTDDERDKWIANVLGAMPVSAIRNLQRGVE